MSVSSVSVSLLLFQFVSLEERQGVFIVMSVWSLEYVRGCRGNCNVECVFLVASLSFDGCGFCFVDRRLIALGIVV